MSDKTRDIATLSWAVLFAALAQAATPLVPFSGIGASPDEATVDLLITPAGYTFSIWSVIYVLSLVFAAVTIRRHSTGTRAPARLLTDLLIAFLGAAAWILLSTAEIPWITPIILTVMTLALLDAADIAAAPPDADNRSWQTTLTRALVGLYAAWATAAVFQNWAADTGRDLGDPDSLWWQMLFLIGSAVLGVLVTARYGATLPLYPVGLLWAFLGIIVAAHDRSTAVVTTCVVTIVAVAAAYLWSLRRHRTGTP